MQTEEREREREREKRERERERKRERERERERGSKEERLGKCTESASVRGQSSNTSIGRTGSKLRGSSEKQGTPPPFCRD
jgi:hypothetical protein